jgi:acetoin utilization protein AcuB
MAVDLKTASVRTWMTPPVPVITPRTTVGTALRLLREHKMPALPVSDGERFVGLVGEKALLRLTPSEMTTLDVYELREVLENVTVARATVPAPETVSPETSLQKAAALMRSTSVELLPVLEGRRLVGLLHWTALLAAAAGEVPGTSPR